MEVLLLHKDKQICKGSKKSILKHLAYIVYVKGYNMEEYDVVSCETGRCVSFVITPDLLN